MTRRSSGRPDEEQWTDVDPAQRDLAAELADQLHLVAATASVHKPPVATVVDHPHRGGAPRFLAVAAAVLVLVAGVALISQRSRGADTPTTMEVAGSGQGLLPGPPPPCRAETNAPATEQPVRPDPFLTLAGPGLTSANGTLVLTQASTRRERLVDGALFAVGTEPEPGQPVIPSSDIQTGPVLTLRPSDGSVAAPWIAVTTSLANVAGGPLSPVDGESSTAIADGRVAYASTPVADVSRVRIPTGRGLTANVRAWGVPIEDLVVVASSVTVDADGAARVNAQPRGTCVAADSPAPEVYATTSASFATPATNGPSAEKVTVDLRTDGADGLSFEGQVAQLIDRVANVDGPPAALPTLRATTVRGHRAVLRLTPVDGRFHVVVLWEEVPGALIGTATIDVTTLERVGPILDTVTTVDAAQWQLLEQRCPAPTPDDRNAMPPTTLVGSC